MSTTTIDLSSPDVIESHTTRWSDAKREQYQAYISQQRIDAEPLIQSGDHVVIENGEKTLVTVVKPNAPMTVRLKKTTLDTLIGQPANGTYTVEDDVYKRRLEGKIDVEDVFEQLEQKDLSYDFMPTGSNKNLVARQQNQSLTAEDLEAMKRSDMGSLEILKKLSQASSTYDDKTEFSQMKWLKKKFAKYTLDITTRAINPSVLLTLTARGDSVLTPYIRDDTLAQMLAMTNIGAHSRTIVVEGGTDGLISGSVQRKQGPTGGVLSIHTHKFQQQAIEDLNLTKEERKRILPMSFDSIISYGFGGQPQEWLAYQMEKIDAYKAKFGEKANRTELTTPCMTPAQEHFLQHKAHGLIAIHSSCDPLSLALPLLPFLLPSSPIVLYSTTIEPLANAMQYLTSNNLVTNCHIYDHFFRPYQVLPNRTHPHMSMPAHGGFLLHCFTVDYFSPVFKTDAPTPFIIPSATNPTHPLKSVLHPLYANTNDTYQYEPLMFNTTDGKGAADTTTKEDNKKRKNPPGQQE